jgi:hypothetical protein
MSFAERRRFLWLCLLGSLILLAITAAAFANGTTLARLRFEDLAQQSTAVARLRCLGSEFLWDRGELWTETRFEVVERNKGLLPGIVTAVPSAASPAICIRTSTAFPYSAPAKKSIYSCGSAPVSRTAFSAGRKVPFASRAMRNPATKPLRKIQPWLPSSTRAHERFVTAESAIYLWEFFS